MSAGVEARAIYEDENHRFIWLGWEEDEDEGLVQTNQYLIINDGVGVLLDPGGAHVFPRVVAETARFIALDKIRFIFYSHQDPDVSSGLPLWLAVTPAKVYISKLWTRFVPHFGRADVRRVEPIEDHGGSIELPTGDRLEFIPAHYLHSVGNFSLYDQRSGILFSGDIGAAAFPPGKRYLFVEDFDSHVKLMEGFHKRYMKSNRILRKWVQLVREKRPKMIAPQHGAIFDERTVEKFLSWLENLRCGEDLIDEFYGR